jgi:trimeric autotransporter adhesin
VCITTGTDALSTSTACTASSLRYKENIHELSYGLKEVLKFNPVTFTYKPEKGIPGLQVGFIAEDMEKIVPEVVGKDSEGRPESIDYGKLTSVLTNAIKEIWHEVQNLIAKVSGLEKKVEAQQKQIDSLTKRLEVLEAK